MIDIVNKAIERKLHAKKFTEIVKGIVTSLDPFQIKLNDRLTIGLDFIELSSLGLDEYSPNSALPFLVGDSINMIRYNNGQRFYILGASASSGCHRDYNKLDDIPTINYIPLVGSRYFAETKMTNKEIADIVDIETLADIEDVKDIERNLVSGCGTKWYTQLYNLPKINDITLIGNRELAELKITNENIDSIVDNEVVQPYVFDLQIEHEDNPYVCCGATDYEEYYELPSINDVILIGNRNIAETPLVDAEIDYIINYKGE